MSSPEPGHHQPTGTKTTTMYTFLHSHSANYTRNYTNVRFPNNSIKILTVRMPVDREENQLHLKK